jgi:hypothetical protein
VLDANIRLNGEGGQSSRAVLTASCRPPLGAAGAGLDRLPFHRVAVATIKTFMTRVAGALEGTGEAAGEAAASSWWDPNRNRPLTEARSSPVTRNTLERELGQPASALTHHIHPPLAVSSLSAGCGTRGLPEAPGELSAPGDAACKVRPETCNPRHPALPTWACPAQRRGRSRLSPLPAPLRGGAVARPASPSHDGLSTSGGSDERPMAGSR